MSRIRLLLVDDHHVVRAGLRMLLAAEKDMIIAGEVGSGAEALAGVKELEPDVVIMDVVMSGMSGIEATRRIREAAPSVAVLALTMHEDEQYFFEMLQAGASGYIVKKAAPTELVSAIRAIKQGGSFLSPSISKRVIDEYVLRAGEEIKEDACKLLTNREREVLQLIAEGYSTREISEKLFVSVKTVEAHRSNLMKKLDLHGTADLTRYAVRRGIVDSEL